MFPFPFLFPFFISTKYSYWMFPFLKQFIKIFSFIIQMTEYSIKIFLLIVPISEIFYKISLLIVPISEIFLSKYSNWEFPCLKYSIKIFLLIIPIPERNYQNIRIVRQNILFDHSHLWNIDENTLIGWYKSVQLLNNQNCTQLWNAWTVPRYLLMLIGMLQHQICWWTHVKSLIIFQSLNYLEKGFTPIDSHRDWKWNWVWDADICLFF